MNADERVPTRAPTPRAGLLRDDTVARRGCHPARSVGARAAEGRLRSSAANTQFASSGTHEHTSMISIVSRHTSLALALALLAACGKGGSDGEKAEAKNGDVAAAAARPA